MPVEIIRIGPGRYRVVTPGGVKARNTTKTKAMKQKRLLNAVEYGGWRPTKKGKK